MICLVILLSMILSSSMDPMDELLYILGIFYFRIFVE